MKNHTVYFLIFFFAIGLFYSCNLGKHLPEGTYLLEENEVILPKRSGVKEDDVRAVLRQTPNRSTLGVMWRVKMFNAVDSTLVAEKRNKKNLKLRKINNKRRLKAEETDQKRMERALKKGETMYRPKRPKFKDTINPRRFFREWLKYEVGESPRIFSESAMNNSVRQIDLLLKRKGYFEGEVSADVVANEKTRKIGVVYSISPKREYVVDTLYLVSSNRHLQRYFLDFLAEENASFSMPMRYDSDVLARLRNELSTYYRNRGIFAFRPSYITFEVDTIGRDYSASVAVVIAKREIEIDGVKVHKPFAPTSINKVHFHILDTMNYKGNFIQEQLRPRSISLSNINDFPLIDTLVYDWYTGRNPQFRTATFYYNGDLSVSPELIEFQNLLEENNVYKEVFLEQSFNRLIQLDLFQQIKPELVENEDNTIDVHYRLVPSKKQAFSFEPRGTTSNGFLGVASSVNYQHKSIFGGGEKLKISFSGGFESQPEIEASATEGILAGINRSFNTFEFGPTAEIEIPGLFPVKMTKLAKRQVPKTLISTAYNFQRREDFKRELFQLNYQWRFYDVKKTQVFTLGIPAIGGFQFISISDDDILQQRLIELNDLFLINAYSNQFIWKDLKFTYQWSNASVKEGNVNLSYIGNLDVAGHLANLVTRNATPNDKGVKEVFGVRFSQFTRIDNDFRINQQLKGERSLNYRVQAGIGVPYGNNAPNLPFDYSFFAGGANDNRGFRARSLGPGVYKYYLDTNRTATEIGDVRLGASLEYRFKISGIFKGALFTDVGNVWNFNEDPNRIGGQFTAQWFRQLAVAGGLGVRVDLDFLVLRLDVGMPFRNPALPATSKWFFQSNQALIDEKIEKYGADWEKLDFPNPFELQFHIGIGYPF
jgi:hypothetical protein